MARRVPRLQRKTNIRRPQKIFHLFCEGKRTEPEYFRELNRKVVTDVIDINIVPAVGTPMTIIKAARDLMKGRYSRKRQLQSFEKNDEVWAVFDRDEFQDYDQAIQEAKDAGINIARSNPCFEVWLILHYEDYHKDEHRDDTQKHLEHLCKGYSRKSGKAADCEKLIEHIELAEKRAQRQLAMREEEGSEKGAPSTTVFKLTRKIRGVEDARPSKSSASGQ